MDKRKTIDKFFIVCKTGFDGKAVLMDWMDFKTESDCDKKLSELRQLVEKSRKDPVLNPFYFTNRYWKVKKRIKKNLTHYENDKG